MKMTMSRNEATSLARAIGSITPQITDNNLSQCLVSLQTGLANTLASRFAYVDDGGEIVAASVIVNTDDENIVVEVNGFVGKLLVVMMASMVASHFNRGPFTGALMLPGGDKVMVRYTVAQLGSIVRPDHDSVEPVVCVWYQYKGDNYAGYIDSQITEEPTISFMNSHQVPAFANLTEFYKLGVV